MLSELERRAIDAIDEEETVDLLRTFIRAPTENPPGNESVLVRPLARLLLDRGIPVELDEVAPGRENLTALVGPEGGRRLLLNAHTDTMPAGVGWLSSPQEPLLKASTLVGRGACDVKGGLASCVEALLAITRSGIALAGSLTLDAVVDEERGGDGTRRTLRRGRAADGAIVMEPTDLRVLFVGNGQVNFEIEFGGEAAHGSAPEAGHNAISDAAQFVLELEAQAGQFAAVKHPLVGAATYNVGTISGGVQTSIVPASCTITVDRRLTPGQTVEDAVSDVDRAISAVTLRRPGCSVTRRTIIAIPAIDQRPDDPLVEVLRWAVANVGSSDPGLGGLRATSDAAQYVEMGIPAVVFGPGSITDSAHRPNEFVPIEEVHRATRALVVGALRFLGIAAEEQP